MAGTIYLVVRWDWRLRDGTEDVAPGDPRTDVRERPDRPGEWERVSYHRQADEGGIPVKAFRDRSAAEAFARAEEEARRAVTNPFLYNAWVSARTSLDDGRLRDWMLDAELEPPGRKGEEVPEKVREVWRRWWDAVRGGMPDAQHMACARALNNAAAGVPYGSQEVADGPTDLASLDERFGSMDRLTPDQRNNVRMGLIGVFWSSYPARDGERDEGVIEETWCQWWDRGRGRMSAYQRQKVWEALDKVRFYEVVEVEEP